MDCQLECQERERTGIDSLKIRFNQVFGYYIELTKANVPRAPDPYIRKQTLSNVERFTTHELKDLEARVTGADLKLIALEQELFEQIRAQLGKDTPRVLAMGSTLAIVDALAALTEAAAVNRYVRPEVHETARFVFSTADIPWSNSWRSLKDLFLMIPTWILTEIGLSF